MQQRRLTKDIKDTTLNPRPSCDLGDFVSDWLRNLVPNDQSATRLWLTMFLTLKLSGSMQKTSLRKWFGVPYLWKFSCIWAIRCLNEVED